MIESDIQVNRHSENMMLFFVYSRFLRDKSTRRQLYKDLAQTFNESSPDHLRTLNSQFRKFIRERPASANPNSINNSPKMTIQKTSHAKNIQPKANEIGPDLLTLGKTPPADLRSRLRSEDGLQVLEEYMRIYGTQIIQFILENLDKLKSTADFLAAGVADVVRRAQKIELESRESHSQEHLEVLFQDPNEMKNEKSVAEIPKGIRNIGYTCYSSCILQMLFHHPRFMRRVCRFRVDRAKQVELTQRAAILAVGDKKRHKLQLTLNGSRFLESLQELFRELASGSDCQASPSEVFERMVTGDGRKMFQVGVQEDVVEFMDGFFELAVAGYRLDAEVRLI